MSQADHDIEVVCIIQDCDREPDMYIIHHHDKADECDVEQEDELHHAMYACKYHHRQLRAGKIGADRYRK